MQATKTLRIGSRLLSLHRSLVMGILNVTPDSFSDGGKFLTPQSALSHAEKMLAEGADIIDIGGASSRPGAPEVSAEEEMNRVLPVVRELKQRFPDAILSIDTYRAEVAKAAVKSGAEIVNDISAGLMDTNMLATVGKLQVPYIAMHMQGTPATMQTNPDYSDCVNNICLYFSERLAATASEGISDVILDPGFGFGKTTDHNFQILRRFSEFQMFGAPLLAGISRKSMLYKTLGCTPEETRNAAAALHFDLLKSGADILRVHDVTDAVKVIRMFEAQKSPTAGTCIPNHN
jgi:dihydropteroate synthase